MVNTKRLLKGFAFAFTFLFVLGFAYPTITAEITQVAIPFQSSGSPVEINGTIYGSYLLADAFNGTYFFHARPSASNTYPIDSNGTLNQTERYISQFRSENPGINLSQVPYAMVAYSASGMDPNVPILGAYDQVQRIAESIHSVAQNLSVNISTSAIASLLNQQINNNEQRDFPIFGSYYVSTVTLNVWIINYMIQHHVMPSNTL